MNIDPWLSASLTAVICRKTCGSQGVGVTLLHSIFSRKKRGTAGAVPAWRSSPQDCSQFGFAARLKR